jgi:hypothetical protein
VNLWIARKPDARRAVSVDLGGTRASPHVLILQSRDPAKRDAHELDDLVSAIAERHGLNKDDLLGKAEEDYAERQRVKAAHEEIKRRQEGNGLWKRLGRRWIMR